MSDTLTIAQKMHILIAEIRRCVEDDRIMASYRKMNALDALVKELESALK